MSDPWYETHIAKGGRVLRVFLEDGEFHLDTLWCGYKETPLPGAIEAAVMMSMGADLVIDRVREIRRIYSEILDKLENPVSNLNPIPKQ